MSGPHPLRAKTFILLVLMVALGSAGDVLLSAGMKRVGTVEAWTPAGLHRVFFAAFTSPTVWSGTLCLIGFFICYMLVLSWADLSYVLPASASSYAIVPLLGFALLGEAVTSLRWTGVALICLGVVLVGRTPPSTTASAGGGGAEESV
jgi:uncharacterized membrane protein